MLENAFKNLPESVQLRERFEVPKVMGHLQGSKTVITNFHQIAKTLGRAPELVFKYILKELASRGDLTKTAAIVAAKIPASRINDKIRQFTTTFVVCVECGKPDTQLFKKENMNYMKCQACGATHTIREKI